MHYFKLYEEFNTLTGKKFAEKLHIYAQASESVSKVTDIVIKDGKISFEIYTKNIGDNGGNKKFAVFIPVDAVNKVYVETYEEGKKVFQSNLEPHGENDIDLILINFIEATGIYDDSSVQYIVDFCKDVKTPQDVKDIISKLG